MTSQLKLYAIIDTKAKAIIGGAQLFRHHAVAIRYFGDVASVENSAVARHPEDYELHQLAVLDDDNRLTAKHEIIMTGHDWHRASNGARTEQTNAEARNQ